MLQVRLSAVKQISRRHGLKPQGTQQTEFGIKIRRGHADPGGLGRQVPFCPADIGPAAHGLGRNSHSHRYRWDRNGFSLGQFSMDRSGIFAQEHRQTVFGRFKSGFQVQGSANGFARGCKEIAERPAH